MPDTQQPTYVKLPNGMWAQVPTDPAKLAEFKTRLQSYLTTHSEKGQVAALPNAAQQAKASINTEMNPVSRVTGAEIPKNNDATNKSAVPGTNPNKIAANFNRNATGAASLPGLYNEMKSGVKKIADEGPISAITDYIQDLSDSQSEAVGQYQENDPKRYVAAIPMVGPALARNEEIGGVEGLAGDLGLIAGARIAGEAIPDAAANTLKATNEAYAKIFDNPKMTMQQATNETANMLSTREISPGDYGKELQDTFDHVRDKAGAEKREFVESVVRQNPGLKVGSKNVNGVLQLDVQNLMDMKARNPELFKEGEALDRTLSILQRELRNTQDYNLAMADTRRGQFWNYKQQLDPSMASRIIGRLDQATTQDITEALAGKDPKLAQEYLEKSARYKEVNDLARTDVLKNVFSDKRVAPDRVMEFMNRAPEEALRAVQTLQRENPAAIADMRRQLFEQSMKTAGAKGLMKLQPSLIKAIYGPQADAVTQFIDLINRKSGTADTLVNRVQGKTGAVLRIMAGKDKPAITIRASEMAKILRSSEILRLFSHAMETPADAPPAAMMQQTLQRAIDALGIRSEAEQRPSRVAAWKREGGGGENPPGGAPAAPAPGGTPPPSGGEGGAHFEAGTGAPNLRPQAPGERVPLWKRESERRASGERRSTTGESPTGTERRSGAADRQLAVLQERLKGATGRDKAIIEEQIASIKAHPGDPEYVDRRGQRAAGQAGPKADVKKMNEAVEKQRQRLKEFEEERDRILKEQGGKEFDF